MVDSTVLPRRRGVGWPSSAPDRALGSLEGTCFGRKCGGFQNLSAVSLRPFFVTLRCYFRPRSRSQAEATFSRLSRGIIGGNLAIPAETVSGAKLCVSLHSDRHMCFV